VPPAFRRPCRRVRRHAAVGTADDPVHAVERGADQRLFGGRPAAPFRRQAFLGGMGERLQPWQAEKTASALDGVERAANGFAERRVVGLFRLTGDKRIDCAQHLGRL
jgi:hypothetical protein